jgi:hypothetical protein
MKRAGLLLCVLALSVGPATSASGGPANPADAAAATSRNLPGTSCPAFPANNIWHADVSKLPVHARSRQWTSHMSPSSRLHPDFGPSYGEQPVPYGIPITYVGSGHAKVRVTFDYADESDKVRYPLGPDTKVEGGQWRTGDRHTIVVDTGTCRLYETWATRKKDGRWYAGSGATWDLKSNALRTAGWTSADAAGLPILPGLLRYDEVVAGKVDHAIRFTTPVTDKRYIWPARHHAGSRTDVTYPPMGARFRLKASYPLTGLRADTKVVLKAMKTYGLMLADNGSAWYFQGTSDTRWKNKEGMLDELKRIPASAFEAVDVSSLKVTSGSGRVG